MIFTKFLPKNFLSNLTVSNEVHKVVVGTIIKVLQIPEADTQLLMLELCLTTASGMWLDEWGSWFGVIRKLDESDAEYSPRILASIQAPKSTLPALEKNIAEYISYKTGIDYTEKDIRIFEPYTKLKTFSDKGGFSMDYHFPDGVYWRRNVIDITIPENIDDKLLSLVNSIRAAGIRVAFTVSHMGGIICEFSDENSYKVWSDSSLVIQPPLVKISEGAMFSVNTPLPSRRRSGKKNLFGVEISLLNEFDITKAYRLAGDSYFYEILKRAYKPVLVEVGVPEQEKQIFSISRGNLSGNMPLHSEYKEVPTIPPDDLIDYTIGFKRLAVNFRPKMFSRAFCAFGNSNPLSGVFNDNWNGKDPHIDVNTGVFGEYNPETKASNLLVTEKYVDTKQTSRTSREMSGKKNIWVDKTTIVTELFDFSPFRFNVVSPSVKVNDLGSYVDLHVNSLQYLQAQSNICQLVNIELNCVMETPALSPMEITISTGI